MMSKAKGKSGTGRGTDKKGWNRWQASAKKAKGARRTPSNNKASNNKGDKSN